MKEYKGLKKLLIFFLIFYFVTGISTEIILPGREKDFVPFFSWFLFIYVPSEERFNNSVLIKAAGDKTFDPPLLFELADDYVEQAKSPKARETIKKMVSAAKSGDSLEVDTLRKKFEDIYLSTPTDYLLAEISYNPLRRFKTGEYKIVHTFGQFRNY